VQAALGWFFSSRWIALAQSLAPQQWLEVDEMDFEKSIFTLDGVRIFAVPDFAYLDHEGRPIVVDWKTGKARGGYDEQVLGYALYLSERYHYPVQTITAALVYLNEGIEQQVQVDEVAIDSFRSHFRRSVSGMRELLVDPAGNVPWPEPSFPMTENLSVCARCVFRRVCGRDAAAQQVA
jgi:hypothetical protein